MIEESPRHTSITFHKISISIWPVLEVRSGLLSWDNKKN